MAVKFTKQISSDYKKLGAVASRNITAATKSAWRVAVRNTPRDTGNAQSGWGISVNRRSSYVPIYGQYKAPPTVPNFNFRITKDKRIYLWNNVPYAYSLEHGEGPGARKPYAMLAKATAHLESELSRRLRVSG